jgi:FixJ family two-component response regulator
MTETDATVFVVDDDDESSIRESLSNLLHSVGLNVQAFATAQEFLTNRPREALSRLVLDVQLGFELCLGGSNYLQNTH